MKFAGKIGASAIFALCATVSIADVAFAGNCFSGAGAATEAEMTSFNSSPASLLGAGAGLSNVSDQVRTLVATNTDVSAQMIALAATAGTSEDQMSWIGAGLGRAATVCRQSHADFADAIQAAVVEAATANPQLGPMLNAFNRALQSQQLPTAALGGAGAGAAGAGAIGGPGSAAGTGIGGDIVNGASGADQEGGTLKTGAGGGGGSRTFITQSVSRSAI